MKVVFLLISLGFGLTSFSQPAIKTFAFEQDNVPGTKPVGITDENGNPVRKVAAKKNYFIFLSFNKSYNITPTQVFIKGNPLTITSTLARKTPIELVNNNIPNKPQKIMLVPTTTNKVLEIQVTEAPGGFAKSTTLQKLTDKNDVVIVYSWKKKTYFLTLKKLKKLDPIFNE
jgi:hypothetical protein